MAEWEQASLSGLGPVAGADDASLISEQLVVPAGGGSSPARIGMKELAAGGSSGGAIIVLANIFIPNSTAQDSFASARPNGYVMLTPMYQWFGGELSAYYKDWKSERKRLKLLRQARTALEEARRQNSTIECDSNATSEHKSKAHDTLQRIESKVLELNVKVILVLE